ncbi:MAG: hypothetical protein EPO48_02175 [Nevskiaceae bacterium]|nr:MAG: hypothetical protein EPO48_02175 [Nevskiaceae bacterium]
MSRPTPVSLLCNVLGLIALIAATEAAVSGFVLDCAQVSLVNCRLYGLLGAALGSARLYALLCLLAGGSLLILGYRLRRGRGTGS